jgi:hypothetical protein
MRRAFGLAVAAAAFVLVTAPPARAQVGYVPLRYGPLTDTYKFGPADGLHSSYDYRVSYTGGQGYALGLFGRRKTPHTLPGHAGSAVPRMTYAASGYHVPYPALSGYYSLPASVYVGPAVFGVGAAEYRGRTPQIYTP